MLIRLRWKYKNVIHDLLCLLYLVLVYIAAYDSYARLGLDNSERIVCQITRKKIKLMFVYDRLLAVHNRALDWTEVQSIIDYNRWLFQHQLYHHSNTTLENDNVIFFQLNLYWKVGR